MNVKISKSVITEEFRLLVATKHSSTCYYSVSHFGRSQLARVLLHHS